MIVKDDQTTSSKPERYIGQTCVYALRGILVAIASLTYVYADHVQLFINELYSSLLLSPLFNSVYFETYFASFSYLIIIPVYPWLVDKITYFDVFKITPSVHYESVSLWFMLHSVFFYAAPLMLLDTFTVKKYSGVEPAVWEEKRQTWIQLTRALPVQAPSLFQIFYQILLSFLLFDVLFFFIHLSLHKNFYLYKYIHKRHHDHDHVYAHVTNQLTVTERIVLVLSANFALKVFNSNPLTRTIFIPIFQGILVDNHSGYDMPFGFHRLFPYGIVGGSVKHYEHHVTGKRAYQPILTYLDAYLERRRTKQL